MLLSYPVERERWFNYRADLLHYHINQWFQAKELEADPPSPWGDVEPPPEPDVSTIQNNTVGQGPADTLRKQIEVLATLVKINC